MHPYNRRPVPPDPLKNFLDVELISIEQAVKDAQGLGGATGVTPGTYGDATHVPQVTVGADGRVTAASNVAIAAGPTTVFLTADVSNSVLATNQATGLKANVVAGSTYTFRWTLWFNSNTNTGGVVPVITHPAYTAALTHHRGNTTGVTVSTETIVNTTTSPLTLVAYVSYSGIGIVVLEHTVVPSASGTIEMTFHPASNGQNYTLKAGSFLQVFGPT